MPYFYVDVLRDGQPAQALYIQAENADAAKARAAQLGMQVTGVRTAKVISNTKLPNLWPLPYFCCLSTLMCVLESLSNRSSGRPPTFTPVIVGATILPMILLIHQYLNKSHQRQQDMQTQIDDLREQLLSRNLLDGRNS